jgi:CBS domain-containing protein
MKSASPLFALKAADLMSREVITLSVCDSLDRAAQLFAKEQISGAPVVDGEGRCVGLLSLADVVRWAEQRGSLTVARSAPLPRTCSFQTKHRDRFGKEMILCTLASGVCPFQQKGTAPGNGATTVCGQPNCVPTDWQVVEMTDSASSTVRDFMTTDLVVAHPADSIADIAQKMIDAHIHRVIVLDEERRPVGIVSTTDCLAAMVRESHVG